MSRGLQTKYVLVLIFKSIFFGSASSILTKTGFSQPGRMLDYRDSQIAISSLALSRRGLLSKVYLFEFQIYCFKWNEIYISFVFDFRYIQVGNAVAVPVAIALGYAFGMASRGKSNDDEPLMKLPFNFPKCLDRSLKIGDDHSDWGSSNQILHILLLLLMPLMGLMRLNFSLCRLWPPNYWIFLFD